MPTDDPLVPLSSLLPLTDTPFGGQRPIDHRPGVLRPLVAALAVVPIVSGKHHTTATRNSVTKATQESKDGVVVPDTVTVTETDT